MKNDQKVQKLDIDELAAVSGGATRDLPNEVVTVDSPFTNKKRKDDPTLPNGLKIRPIHTPDAK